MAILFCNPTMLVLKFFKNNNNSIDPKHAGEKWYLKPHAEKDFFAWVNQWSIMAKMPSDLGFSDEDRQENIRRVGEVAKLMVDAGLVVLSAFISPFQAERKMVRELVDDGEFIEVFLDTPLAVCETRDPKGLYKKARAGEIKNFTGIDSTYEAPQSPEISLDTGANTVADSVNQIIAELKQRNII